MDHNPGPEPVWTVLEEVLGLSYLDPLDQEKELRWGYLNSDPTFIFIFLLFKVFSFTLCSRQLAYIFYLQKMHTKRIIENGFSSFDLFISL